MREVSGPIIAIALVLVAVFVPLAFISGLTGQFYRQFAVTIAISTVISAINSLTLSPALAALLLRGHDAPKDRLTRGMDQAFGWLFRGFNRLFGRGSEAYGGGVKRVISRKALMMAIYLALVGRDRRPVQGRAERLRAGAGQAVPDRLRAAARRRHARPHRRGDPAHGRDHGEEPERRRHAVVPGPVDQRLHQQLELRHRVRDAQALRRAQARRPERRRGGDAAEPRSSRRSRTRSSSCSRRRR